MDGAKTEPISDVTTRQALLSDLPRLAEIYNHYILNTPITFNTRPFTTKSLREWFEEHSDGKRHRLVVATENGGRVIGYAGSGRFRPKQAYETTVETTIYCSPECTHRGVGTLLYRALFELLAGEDIHRVVAGVTLPNPASVALHERFGFRHVGTFTENGRKFGKYWDVAWFERPLKVGETTRK
jgi:phosphinothricin acetyltransferase